jgi:hypothetical protein
LLLPWLNQRFCLIWLGFPARLVDDDRWFFRRLPGIRLVRPGTNVGLRLCRLHHVRLLGGLECCTVLFEGLSHVNLPNLSLLRSGLVFSRRWKPALPGFRLLRHSLSFNDLLFLNRLWWS